MAIELKNKITFTKNTTIYGHTGLDEGGFPTGAGNSTIGEILDLENADLKEGFSFCTDSSNNRKYILKLFGEEVATFTVPVDKFIKSVSYDETTRKLVFVFYKADETEETVYVDISDLVDTYTAGNGLQVSNNEFSVKVKSGESVLKVGADGAYTDMSSYNTSSEVDTKIKAHTDKTDNPHSVTKAQVGLSNCDNTADLDKPVSTATQTELNKKQDTSNLVTTWQATPDDTRYPSEKLVKDNLDGKANSSHTHAIADVSGLQDALDGKMDAGTIDTSNLVSKSGDTMTGDLLLGQDVNILPVSAVSSDLGDSAHPFLTGYIHTVFSDILKASAHVFTEDLYAVHIINPASAGAESYIGTSSMPFGNIYGNLTGNVNSAGTSNVVYGAVFN